MLKEKEKKIGVLTLYYANQNFGGLLQAYALQKFIEQNVGPCEQISYLMKATPFKQKLLNTLQTRPIKETFQLAVQKGRKKICIFFTHKKMGIKLQQRIKKFRIFEQNIPHSKKIFSYEDIGSSISNYHTYVVGSDQVWNGGINLETFCLKPILSGAKKISYAASSGGTQLSKWQKEIFQKTLNDFSAISVREASLKKSVEPYFKKEVAVVLDPVFLLPVEQWEQMSCHTPLKQPYIVCYFLGDNKEHRKIACELAKKLNCTLITFPYITNQEFRFCDKGFGDVQDFESGPAEFLGLVKGAQAVITDSFHAVAFSIIFQKAFCVFPRYFHQTTEDNSRIENILRQLGLRNHLVKDSISAYKSIQRQIDYTSVNQRLEEKKRASIDWLLQALEKDK